MHAIRSAREVVRIALRAGGHIERQLHRGFVRKPCHARVEQRRNQRLRSDFDLGAVACDRCHARRNVAARIVTRDAHASRIGALRVRLRYRPAQRTIAILGCIREGILRCQ